MSAATTAATVLLYLAAHGVIAKSRKILRMSGVGFAILSLGVEKV